MSLNVKRAQVRYVNLGVSVKVIPKYLSLNVRRAQVRYV